MPRKWPSLRSNALRVVLLQFILVLIGAMVLLLAHNINSGYSFLLGGLISILPNFIFTYYLFSETGAQALTRILRRFYLGEALKIVVIGFLFIGIVRFFAVDILPFIGGFITAQLGVVIAPIIFLLKS